MNMFHNMSLYRCSCGVDKATITSADGGDEITPIQSYEDPLTRIRVCKVVLVP